MKKSNKKWFILFVFLFFICVCGLVYIRSQDDTQRAKDSLAAAPGQAATFKVQVIHSDGKQKAFTYTTDQLNLGDYLKEQGLISGDESEYGLYVTTVDGESADYDKNQSWWQLIIDEDPSDLGVSETEIEDGETYTWKYTIGQ